MYTWIALLRGINVGGHNRLPMQELTTTLESVGCRSVRTYIQSGNVVFDSPIPSQRRLAQQLGDVIEAEFAFRPHIQLLPGDTFRTAVVNNPFPEVVSEPKTLHFFFLESAPDSPDLDGIAKLAAPTERFKLVGSVFYLHAPAGFGRSKLSSGVELKLGRAATARNYTTIQHLLEMLNTDQPRPSALVEVKQNRRRTGK